jgi:hypothetical protein
LLERLRANKPEFLMVLDRPEIPLHTDGSERDIRCHVTKRKVSSGTRSVDRRDCRDAFLDCCAPPPISASHSGIISAQGSAFLTSPPSHICQTSAAVVASPPEHGGCPSMDDFKIGARTLPHDWSLQHRF